MSKSDSHHAHQVQTKSTEIDPYRIFFPLGIITGILGVSFWPLYSFGWIEAIHSQAHIDMQLQGFLYAFILGFLLTAIPRFSRTWPASKAELIVFVSLFIVGNISTLFGYFLLGRLCFFLSIISLFIFSARRFIRRQANPPNQFIFVGMGILVGFFASSIRILLQLGWASLRGIEEFSVRRMLSEGMTTFLVLGIGAKLIPLFFGFKSYSQAGDPVEHEKQSIKERIWFLGLATIVLVSFFIEMNGMEKIALYIRAIVVSIVLLFHVKIWKKLKSTGVMVRVIQGSCWAILLSFWGAVIHPEYRIEVLHILFISGFATLIMSIATRVVLSHGNYPVEHEKKSKSLLIGAILLLFSTVFRSVSSLFPMHYFHLLGIAGVLFIAGFFVWGSEYVKKIAHKAPKQI